MPSVASLATNLCLKYGLSYTEQDLAKLSRHQADHSRALAESPERAQMQTTFRQRMSAVRQSPLSGPTHHAQIEVEEQRAQYQLQSVIQRGKLLREQSHSHAFEARSAAQQVTAQVENTMQRMSAAPQCVISPQEMEQLRGLALSPLELAPLALSSHRIEVRAPQISVPGSEDSLSKPPHTTPAPTERIAHQHPVSAPSFIERNVGYLGVGALLGAVAYEQGRQIATAANQLTEKFVGQFRSAY